MRVSIRRRNIRNQRRFFSEPFHHWKRKLLLTFQTTDSIILHDDGKAKWDVRERTLAFRVPWGLINDASLNPRQQHHHPIPFRHHHHHYITRSSSAPASSSCSFQPSPTPTSESSSTLPSSPTPTWLSSTDDQIMLVNCNTIRKIFIGWSSHHDHQMILSAWSWDDLVIRIINRSPIAI